MILKHASRRLAVLTLIAIAATALVYVFSGAELRAATGGSNTIKMSPVRTDINMNPGESRQIHVTATNLTDQPVLVRPVVNDFVSGDESGTPALILDDNQYAPTRSLKRFVTEIGDVLINGRESKTINVNISVPNTARPGGYFGAIRLATANPESGGQVNLSASVASLVLLRVNGDAIEDLTLTDFYIKDGGDIKDIFNSTDNVNVSVRFENTGDVQLGPFGKVVVMKYGVVVYELDFNNKNARDMILPGSARMWDIPLEKIDEFGEYSVHAFFTYGQKNQTIEVSKSFWVIPYIWIVIAASVLVGILLLITLFISYRRKRKYRSVGRARRR